MKTLVIGERTFTAPYAELLRPLTEEEYAALKEDIQQRGVVVPLVVDESDAILDGLHRATAAEELGLSEVPTLRVEGLSEGEKRSLARALNLHRRHFTPEERRAEVLRLAQEGGSVRVIAEKLGVPKSTVHRDLSFVPRGTNRTSGTDGRSYPATRPHAPPREGGAGTFPAATPSAPTPVPSPAVGDEGGEDEAPAPPTALAPVGPVAPDSEDEPSEAAADEAREEARRRREEEQHTLARAAEIRRRRQEESRQQRTAALAEESARAKKTLGSPLGGPFSVLLADPPWAYHQLQNSTRGVENQYPTLGADALVALGPHIDRLTTSAAILFLWATSPCLPEAFKVLAGWGFDYKQSWVWVKEDPETGAQHLGMGFWGRVQHELVLVGTKGSFPTPPESARHSTVFRAPRREHSAKPPIVRFAIEEMFPGLARVELFGRAEAAGWTVVGDAIDGRDIREVLAGGAR